MTISRRHLLVAAASTLVVVPARGAEPILTDDGIYKQPWFLESFLELAEDLDEAQKAGKRFAVMWELKGCPYCKETHFVNFARDDISNYIKGNFVVLQLSIIGSRKVTDFDGQVMSEKELAAKYGVRFTPTFQFFDENAAALKEREPQKREVARAAGYLRPADFLAMFRFVRERAYRDKSFRDYVRSQPS